MAHTWKHSSAREQPELVFVVCSFVSAKLPPVSDLDRGQRHTQQTRGILMSQERLEARLTPSSSIGSRRERAVSWWQAL